jgi:hypothetical protein
LSRPRGRKNRAWSASMVGADRIGKRGGRPAKILISALLIVFGDRVDVQPDIASRVRHGRYRKAVSGGHPAIVENPGPRFRIVVINREPRIPVRDILKADGLPVFKLLALSGRRERQQSRNQAPYAAVHGISPQVANAPVGACSTTCLQHRDIRRGRQSSRRRQASATGRSKAGATIIAS